MALQSSEKYPQSSENYLNATRSSKKSLYSPLKGNKSLHMTQSGKKSLHVSESGKKFLYATLSRKKCSHWQSGISSPQPQWYGKFCRIFEGYPPVNFSIQ